MILQSCKKEPEGWDIDALVPLVDSKLDLKNIFEDSLVQGSDNELLRLVYRSDFLDFKLDDDFVIPDTTVTTSYSPFAPNNEWDKRSPLVSEVNRSRLNARSVNLKYARIKSGKIIFKVTSSVSEPVIARYIMPIATKGKDTLSVRQRIPGATGVSTPSIVELEIDLEGYLLDLRGENENDFNTILYRFEMEFEDPNNPDTIYNIQNGEFIALENTFTEVVPEYGKGVFLTQTISTSEGDDEGFDVFSQFLGGSLQLDEANFDLTFENYVGADLEANINQLIAVNDRTNESVPLSGEVIGRSINVGRAKEDYSLSYPHIIPTQNNFSLNDKNSNITDLIANQPTKLQYNVDFTVNPRGNLSGGNDFIYNGFGVKAAIDIDIPLCVKAENLILFDTTEFAPGTKEEELNNIVGGYMKIICDNTYPLSASVKIDLYDDKYDFIMTLLEPESTIAAGIPETDGIVRKAVRSELLAPVSPELIDNFYRSKHAIVYLTFNTEGSDPVKLYANYNTIVKVVGDLQYNVIVK